MPVVPAVHAIGWAADCARLARGNCRDQCWGLGCSTLAAAGATLAMILVRTAVIPWYAAGCRAGCERVEAAARTGFACGASEAAIRATQAADFEPGQVMLRLRRKDVAAPRNRSTVRQFICVAQEGKFGAGLVPAAPGLCHPKRNPPWTRPHRAAVASCEANGSVRACYAHADAAAA